MGVCFSMNPFILHLGGPLNISWYGLFLVCSVSLFLYGAYTDIRRSSILNTNQFFDCAAVATLSGLVGGKLLFMISQFDELYVSSLTDIMHLIIGGYAILGAIVGAVLGLWGMARWYRLEMIPLFDLAGAYALLAHGIARVGCFIAGCCYGVPALGRALSIVYTHPASLAPLHMRLFPVQLLMAVVSLIGFVVCRQLYHTPRRRDGLVFGVYIIWECAARFGIEFWRGDRVTWYAGLSAYQWCALGMIVLALLFLRTNVFVSHARRRWK